MADIVEALSLAALVAATLEYALLIRHREERREAIQWHEEMREALMSVGRVESSPMRRWTDDGTRFRLVR